MRRNRFMFRGSLLVATVLAITLAVPVGQPRPSGGSEFPLAGLWRLFGAQLALAFEPPVTPGQGHGGPVGGPHEVSTDATRAGGGHGRAATKVPGALEKYRTPSEMTAGISLPAPVLTASGPCAPEAADEAAAGLLARRCGHAVEVAGLRSETAQVWAQPDGTYRARLHVSPERFFDGKTWRDTDLTLVMQSDGSVAPKAHPRGLRLAGSVQVGNGAEVVSVRSGKDSAAPRIGLRWAGRLPTPVLAGETATYRDVMPDVDLVIKATTTGYEQFWVLKSDRAVPQVALLARLGLAADGLRVAAEGGGLTFKDGSGAMVAGTQTPAMWDAATDARSGEPVNRREIGLALAKERTAGAALGLRLAVDKAWLSDPARQFPITIDPSLSASGDTFVQSDYSSSQWNSTELKLGTYNGGSVKARSFLRWDWSPIYGKDVEAATLYLWEWHAYSCRAAEWQLHISGWVDHTTTWSNQPAALQYFHSSTETVGHPDCAADNWVKITATDLVRKVAAEQYPYYTMQLRAGNENHSDSWKRFNSGNASAGRPFLDFVYRNKVPQVLGQYPPHGHASRTLTPELMVEAYDEDNGPYPMSYRFQVFDLADTSTPVYESDWTSSRSHVAPSGKLQWSKSYVWTVWVSDGKDLSSSQSINYFSTSVPQAPITSSLSQNADKGFAPNVGNYTTSAVDAQVPTAGPTLAISRSYNSRDPRTGSAFGAGWSSILDSRVAEVGSTLVVTYPTGQELAFGRNADGSFISPPGRYATVRAVTGGYELVDKVRTKYLFTTAKGGGVYLLTSISDAQDSTLALAYTDGKVVSMTSASGRKLTITWVGSQVTEVTDDAGQKWTYTYSGTSLTTVCPPTSATQCHSYEYGANSLYPTSVHDGRPHTYLRMNEATGAVTAASSVVDNPDTATGVYNNVSLGQPGPLPSVSGSWTAPTAAGFNGTSSYLDFSAPKVAMKGSVQSVSMWFKTTAKDQVLLSYNRDAITNATTDWNYTPVLYVGSSGKLRGNFWHSGDTNFVSTNVVNDGQWHHVAIVANATVQYLYIDGVLNSTVNGAIRTLDAISTDHQYIGAGFLGGTWPDQPHYGVDQPGYATFFNGTIGEFAFHDHPLTEAQVKLMAAAGKTASRPMTKLIRPSGGVTATVEYDAASGVVRKVTDANNGVWQVVDPVVTGSGSVYSSAVLGSAPSNYWRMQETSGSLAVNQINGQKATYVDVALGAEGPFNDTEGSPKAAGFNGTSSYAATTEAVVDTTKPFSVSAFVKLDHKDVDQYLMVMPGPYGSALKLAYAKGNDRWSVTGAGRNSDGTTAWWSVYSPSGLPKAGQWALLTFTADPATGKLALYADGELAAETTTTVPLNNLATSVKIGTEYGTGFLDGSIAEVATFRRVVPEAEVAAHFKAYGDSAGSPVKTVAVTDPAGNQTSHVYDLINGLRQVRQIDPRGGVMVFGYDVGGFLRTVTDPNGNMSVEEHDGRGNVLASTTCQNLAQNKCSTVYKTYYPEGNSSTALTADPRNDLLLTVRDGRSSGPADDAYKTTYVYDASGNLTSVTDPLGRVTKTDYTTAGKYIPHDLTGLTGSGRYVRMLGINRGYTAGYSLWDLQIFGPTGGDLAFGLPATASSVESSSLPARYAVDGNPMTRWSSAYTDAEWIYVDLGASRQISRVRLVWEKAYGKNYEIQVSDDATNWTTIRTVTNGSGVATPAGLPLRVTAPSGAIEQTSFTAGGDVAMTIDAAGLETMFEYDAVGRAVKRTVKADTDLVTTFGYDQLGRIKSQTEPKVINRVTGAEHTAVTTVDYGADGHILSQAVSDGTGGEASRTITQTYNSYGQPVSITDAAGGVRSVTYDSLGRVVTETDPEGTKLTFEYDKTGNLIKTTVNGWTGDPNNPQPAADLRYESRAYDPGGRLASVTDAMGWITEYRYTDNGLVASITRRNPSDGASFVVETAEYDAAGNLIKRITNNGATVTEFTVDEASQPKTQVIDPAGVNRKAEYSYNSAGDVISTRISTQSGQQIIDTAYDLARRRTSQSVSASETSGLVGRWKLDGNTADAFGNSPGAATDVTWSAERDGSAVFNGSTSKITAPGPLLDTAQSFTLSAWVKLDDTNATRVIVGQKGNNRFAFNLEYSSWFNAWAAVAGSSDTHIGGSLVAHSDAAPAVGTWTHIAGVYDAPAETVTLYVNGVAQAKKITGIRLWSGHGVFTIGNAGGQPFKGSLDDVQAHNIALSAAQIQQLHDGTAADVEAQRVSWALDKQGLPKSMRDPNGSTTLYQHDEAGRLTTSIAPSVAAEEYGLDSVLAAPVSTAGYDTFGDQVEIKDPKGNVVTYVRDANGRVVETRLPMHNGVGPVYRTAYDRVGRVVNSQDPLLNATSYAYDQMGRVAKVTVPNGGETKYTYTLKDQPLSVTDPTGARVEATYDFLGRTLTTTQVVRQPSAQQHTTTYGYHSAGWLKSVTAPGRTPVTYQYNAIGEMTSVVDRAGSTTAIGYDFAGRQASVTLADNSKQTAQYDAFGRQIAQREYGSDGTLLASKSATYDRKGNVLSSTDFRGNTTTFEYDATGMLRRQVEPVSGSESIISTFGYDLAGAPTRFTNGRGSQFWTTYNPWGLPEKQIEPATAAYTAESDRTFANVYDAAGRVTSQMLPGGVSSAYTYNALGQVTEVSGTGAEAATANRTFGYDLAGRMTSLSGSGGTNSLSYDDRGLLLSVTGPSGDSSFTYTADGLTASRADAAGTTSYGYDNAGRLASVSNPDQGVQVGYSYNALSQVGAVTYGDSGNLRQFGYDTRHRLVADELKTPGGQSVAKIAYDWDANGNEVSKTTTGFSGASTNMYTYDWANRLTSWNNGTATVNYAYDQAGNRTQAGGKTFAYDERNQLVSSSDGTSYAYTARGNLRGTTTGTVTLQTQSDAFGQVARQYHSETQYSEYSYDGLGRAIRSGFSYSGLGNDLAADGTSTYTRDPGGGLLGVAEGGVQTLAWTDLHQDVVGQFRADSTALVGSTEYDPLGRVVSTSSMNGNLGYQGEWTDSSTGRVNMHSRWYNPETGQFDSRDTADVSPAPASGRANKFGYAGGNPLTRVDPSGNDFIDHCNGLVSCLVKGFVNSFDIVSMAKGLWNAISNIEKAINQFVSTIKNEAASWASKIRGMFKCPWFVPNALCDGAAKVGGWACALSGVCEIIEDCVGGNTNKCAEHVGAALADVVVSLITAGAGAISKKLLGNLIKKFNLPDKKNRDNDSNNGGHNHNDDIDSEMDLIRDHKRNKDKNKDKKKDKNNNGSKPGGPKKPNGKGGSSSGSSDSSRGASQYPPLPVRPQRHDPATLPALNLGDIKVPGCPGRHSFSPGTKVVKADGQTVAIADVKVGDEVVATDPETGETSTQPVTALHHNLDHDLVDVTVSRDASAARTTGEGEGERSTRGPTSTLHTTEHHPFWDASSNQWVNAADLKPGVSTLVGPDGEIQSVVGVRKVAGFAFMRDLTVDDVHTYYVVAGSTPVLVHNCGGPLFRGTTPDYAGSPGTQRVGITPTSTDPGVATIFATHSESYGAGVVQIAHPGSVSGVPRYPGYIAAEAEVGLEMSPLDFAGRADITIPASAARNILAGMGISIPRRIGIEDLSGLLENTPKLTTDQITAFVQAAANHGR